MSSRPWYKWYPGDYLADTYSLSWDADLLYRRILDALWEHGSLPTDLGDLSKICRIDPRKIRRIFPEVLPYLSEISGRYHHPKMTEQRAQAIEHGRKARKAGRKGGVANAEATRARARAHARSPRAPDQNQIDQELHLNPSTPPTTDAREAPATLTPAQRAEAEAIQAELEERRRAAGLAPGGHLRAVAGIAAVVAGMAKEAKG